jgi:hypothetical protein
VRQAILIKTKIGGSMTDDLVEKLRRWAFKFCGKGEQENLASDAMSEAADRIEHLERELVEERHSREVAAAKGWEFSDRIKELEKKLQLAIEMRLTQKLYFKVRTPDLLINSKMCEAAFDRAMVENKND